MNSKSTIIGRKAEQEALNGYFASNKSEFIALYGRRRVGKTFLIRETLGSEFLFYVSGILERIPEKHAMKSLKLRKYPKEEVSAKPLMN